MLASLLALAALVAAADLNNAETWALLIGAFLPPLIAIVQQPRWPSGLRSVVTVVICIIVGGVTSWISSDGLDFDADLVGTILRVLLAAQATYVAFWKRTGVAPAVEAATTPGRPPDGR